MQGCKQQATQKNNQGATLPLNHQIKNEEIIPYDFSFLSGGATRLWTKFWGKDCTEMSLSLGVGMTKRLF